MMKVTKKITSILLISLFVIGTVFSSFTPVQAEDYEEAATLEYACQAFIIYAKNEGWTEAAIVGTVGYMLQEGAGYGTFTYEAYYCGLNILPTPDGKYKSKMLNNAKWLNWLHSENTRNAYRRIYANLDGVQEWAIGLGLCQWSDTASGTMNATKFIEAAQKEGKAWQDPEFQIPYTVEYIYAKKNDADYIDPKTYTGSAEEYNRRVTTFVGMPGYRWNEDLGFIHRHAARTTEAQKLYDTCPASLPGFSFTMQSEKHDISILETTLGPFGSLEQTIGSGLFDGDEEDAKRLEINREIYESIVDGTSTNDTRYSLYDRFGSKLQFVNYYGEASTDLSLFDHLITLLVYGELGDLSVKEDILNYSSPYHLSTKVYANRPIALPQKFLTSGYTDTRTLLSGQNHFGQKFSTIHANVLLKVSSFITETVCYLLSGEIQADMYDILYDALDTEIFDEIKTTLKYIMIPIFAIVLLITIIRHAISFSKGNSTIGRLVGRLLMCAIAIGVFFFALTNPPLVLEKAYKAITITDTIFKNSLSDLSLEQNDEVVASDNYDSAIQANIWKVALFQPWCEGTFGTTYENLYTQFDEDSSHTKMEQSHEDLENVTDSKVHYDSASLTGDISVDLGNGVKVKNWAAFAYSTLSLYHIDAEVGINEMSIKDEEEALRDFPNALFTADGKYYADTFRWIDAKMNISPEYVKKGDSMVEIPNYTSAIEWDPDYYSAGWSMLWRSFLLLGLLPITILKLKGFLSVLFQAVKGIWYGLWEVFKENEGLSGWLQDMKKSLIDYFYRSMQLYILIMLYLKFVESGDFLKNMIFIVITVIFTIVSPDELRNTIYKMRRKKQLMLGSR